MAVPEIHLNSGSAEEMAPRNMALEDSVNTEAFVSPKNDMFTSSPNGDDQMHNLPSVERDANIIHVRNIDCHSFQYYYSYLSFGSASRT